MNYIHNIDYKVKETAIEGQTSEGLYNAVVEISTGDNVKYEVHPDGYYLTAVRTLSPIFRYPFNYGFIPQTLAEDGDGLDVIIIAAEPLAHLSVIEIRPLGYIETIDRGLVDTKIIAVPAYSHLKKVSVEKVMAFLKNYKYPENDTTEVKEYLADAEGAIVLIESAHKAFDEKYRPWILRQSAYCCEPVFHMKVSDTPQAQEEVEPVTPPEPIIAPEPITAFEEPLQEAVYPCPEDSEGTQGIQSVEPEPVLEDIPVMEEPIYDSEVSTVAPDTMDSNNQSIEQEIPQVIPEEPVVQEEVVSQPVTETVEENKQEKIQDNSGWLT